MTGHPPRGRPARPAQPTQPASYHLPVDEVARLLEVETAMGLTEEEVRKRRHQVGPNRIAAPPGVPGWLRFLRQIHQPLVYILVSAGIITALLGSWVDSAVILGIVVVNAAVGYLQEDRAGRAIDSLSRLVRTYATVRREGREFRVDAEELVPGDIVRLEAGDRVPADLRLYAVRNLQVDESAITGESVPVPKHPERLAVETLLADRRNLAFTGSLVTTGTGTGIVWATGDRTETGHIARLIGEATEGSTPLTRKIAAFSRLLLLLILALAAGTFAIGVLHGEAPADMFMAAVALSVGAIPEGLPAAVTVVLAIGVARMARRQAIIRRLPAVETLGSTTVICSDKTGTLTENQMTVREIHAGGRFYAVSGSGYDPSGEILDSGDPARLGASPALAECLLAGALCNDARLFSHDGQWEAEGDPTEAALLVSAAKAGLAPATLRSQAPRIDAIPFASEQMFRATLHDTADGRMIYKVGAAERLLDRCTHQLDDQGVPVPLDREAANRALEGMAARGLRVIALARRSTASDHVSLEFQHVATDLTFLGFQGMLDPPRPEATAAVARCREAGIAVKMITGDHLVTARAIAGQIGLAPTGGGDVPALSGRELDDLGDAALVAAAETTVVFARVAPDQKFRLVRALQSRGHIVAMTGDGVNDAPALRQADIGVAMGRGGTDVAKGAADMVLADDNFASIEAAVEEGRGVFDNLTKFIVWTLPTNAGEALVLVVAILLGLQLPALPVQLLWVNMTTAMFLGLMLVFEPREPELMRRPPRDPRRPLLTRALFMRTGLVSLIMLVGAYWVFGYELNAEVRPLASARTAVVNLIVAVELAYLFNCRSLHRFILGRGRDGNVWAGVGALSMIGVQLLFTYAPIMNRLFHTAPLPPESWLRISGVALFALIAVELEKWIRFRRRSGLPPE